MLKKQRNFLLAQVFSSKSEEIQYKYAFNCVIVSQSVTTTTASTVRNISRTSVLSLVINLDYKISRF